MHPIAKATITGYVSHASAGRLTIAGIDVRLEDPSAQLPGVNDMVVVNALYDASASWSGRVSLLLPNPLAQQAHAKATGAASETGPRPNHSQPQHAAAAASGASAGASSRVSRFGARANPAGASNAAPAAAGAQADRPAFNPNQAADSKVKF